MESNSPKSSVTKVRFWTPGRIVISLVAIGLVSAVGLSSCNSNETPVANANTPANRIVITSAPTNRSNTTAPTNAPPVASVALPADVRETKLKTLPGDSLKLSDYSNKVIVVNTWATRCGPCRQEIPDLVKMSNE